MKRKTACFIGTAAVLAGAWSICRNARYPLPREYRVFNKFFIPGILLSPKRVAAGNRLIRKMKPPQLPEGVEKRTEWVCTDENTRIRLTIYEPEQSAASLPCLVYYHGGGFCFEDAWYIHRNAAEYAKTARCKVVFVHYRTSDIAPFPTPFADCCAGLGHVWDNSERLGIDRAKIAVGGDSAGGALAAACCLWARDLGRIKVCFQMLLYPVTDSRMEHASMQKYVDSPLWNRSLNKKMWQLYLREGEHGQRAYASPLQAEDFSRLPPAYVEVEEFDCLHDEGIAYAEALRKAGCLVQLEDVKGTFHGFDIVGKAEQTRRMLRIRGDALRHIFWN